MANTPLNAGNTMPDAPEWAVEAWKDIDTAYECAADPTIAVEPAQAGLERAALELSRRCVPIEEYQRVVWALRGMVHIQDILDEEGTCDNSVIDPRVAAARAALKETTDADR